MNKIGVIQQLLERLVSVKGSSCGDVYGLIEETDTSSSITLVAAASAELSQSSSLPHDPALLLPAALQLCAGYVTDKEGLAQNYKHEHSLLLTVKGSKVEIQHKNEHGLWTSQDFSIISQEEFEDELIACRGRFSLDLSSRDKTADVKAIVAQTSARLSSSACFLHTESDLVLDGRGEEGVVSCGSSRDQCVGDLLGTRAAKPGYKTIESAVFDLLLDKSCCSSIEAPVVKVSNDKVKIQNAMLKGECITYVFRSMAVGDVGKILLKSVLQRVKLAEYWLIKLLTDTNVKGNLETLNALPYKSGHFFSLLFPRDTQEDYLKDYRKSINETFLLPVSCPFMRRNNAFEFSDAKEGYHLYNTHIGLKAPTVTGLTSITKGTYSYHHYMQDKFNDNKWGCAYRSLQTIMSWYRHQGYTDKPVATHREIQQCLVSLGDKPGKFIGSTEWIGSTEVGFVLESYLGVTSRFISVSSGDELSEKGRELVHHFNTQGTPVMIGGGVLAHTILGVAWNPDSGDISYLILDPHYTGAEDLNMIQRQGWCGWKSPKFWSSKAYYNLCLPQRPNVV